MAYEYNLFTLLSVFYFVMQILVLAAEGERKMRFGEEAKNLTVLQGETANLVWRYYGKDDNLDGIKWMTYFPSGSTNIDFVWSTRADGSKNTRFPEKSKYRGRVSGAINERTVTLTIEDVKLEDANNYICVFNIAGNSNPVSSAVTLIVAEHPGPPVIKDITAGATFIDLTWNPPVNDGRSPITKYMVMVREHNDEQEAIRSFYTAGCCKVKIRRLKMEKTYSLGVAAYNMAARGEFSKMKLVKTRYEGVPLAPQISNKEKTLSTNSLLLKWYEPDNGGHPIIKYNIHLKKKDEISWTVKDIPGNYTLEHLMYLDWGSSYQIRVFAWNIEGSSLMQNASSIEVVVPGLDETRLTCFQYNNYYLLLCEDTASTFPPTEFEFELQGVVQRTGSNPVIGVKDPGEWKCRVRANSGWTKWSTMQNTSHSENVIKSPVVGRQESGESCNCKTCLIISSIMAFVLIVLLIMVAVLIFTVCTVCLRKKPRHSRCEMIQISGLEEPDVSCLAGDIKGSEQQPAYCGTYIDLQTYEESDKVFDD